MKRYIVWPETLRPQNKIYLLKGNIIGHRIIFHIIMEQQFWCALHAHKIMLRNHEVIKSSKCDNVIWSGSTYKLSSIVSIHFLLQGLGDFAQYRANSYKHLWYTGVFTDSKTTPNREERISYAGFIPQKMKITLNWQGSRQVVPFLESQSELMLTTEESMIV